MERIATRDLIASEAADWFVRLARPGADVEERSAFAVWLRRSPEHVEEYLAIAGVWGESRAAVEAYGPAEALLIEARQDDDNVLAMPASAPAAFLFAERALPPSARRRTWLWGGLAACVVAVAAAALWLGREDTVAARSYVTGESEQLRISLRDGSVVYLNAHSRVTVRFSGRERRIELQAGEARFHVARDARRPFLAVTDRATVTALGTVFNVLRAQGTDTVTVIEGKVEVRATVQGALHEARPAVTELSRGEEATVQSAGTLARQQAPDMERVLSWTDHRLSFRDKRLDEVIDEFNRYNSPPIAIEGPGLEGLRISGAFRADDPQSLLAYLERHESVRIVRRADGAITLQQKQVPENTPATPLIR